MSDWTVPGTGSPRNGELWRELYGYWIEKHASGGMPTRQDIDPLLEVPRLVANLMILEVLPDGYEYRLMGSEAVHLSGVDLTNRRAGQSSRFSAVLDRWIALLDLVRDTGCPRLLHAGPPTHAGPRNVALLLPLRPAPGENMRILAGVFQQEHFDPSLQVENLPVIAINE